MTDKIPVFDIGDTLVPSRKETNKTIKRKLSQEGITQAPDFPIYEYNIHKPEEVEEWLEEHGIETDPEKLTLAYEGSIRRYMQRKDIVKVLRELGENHGPIGFITDNSVEAKEFFEKIFNPEIEEDEDGNQLEDKSVNYQGFIVSEEVGVEKPKKELFEAFLEERDEPAEKFVYFGNNADKDKAAKKAGMDFVWVKRYDTFDSEYDGVSMGKVSVKNVEKAIEKISDSENED